MKPTMLPRGMNGIGITAPMDVHFDENNIVQPDIIYIAEENFEL